MKSLFSILALFFATVLAQDPYDRTADPVVLTGADIPEMSDQFLLPELIVGYRYDAANSVFIQVPIQIDERHMQKWNAIKKDDCYTQGRENEENVYADVYTYSGGDTESTGFDSNDELVFMARHLGDQYDNVGAYPPDILPVPMAELNIVDPLLGNSTRGYLYLFLLQSGNSDTTPDAGQQLVSYKFNLTKTGPGGTNAYLDAYEIHCNEWDTTYECLDPYPKNPEDTWFRSPYYERHFAQNWYSDVLKIFNGGANGNDILSIQEFQFLLENCNRCIESFMDGSTAFITNKAGPVRAIRSWVGANSGCITVREHHMYEMRDDQISYLRVHPIPGAMDYIIYETGTPLTYYNCYHTEGITIDGIDDGDVMNQTMCHWEYTTGPSGTYIRTLDVEHNLHNDPSDDPDEFFRQWYYDNATPECPDCGDHGAPVYVTGDRRDFHMCGATTSGQVEAWGTHGVKMEFDQFLILNTDPLRLASNYDPDTLPESACIPEAPQLEYRDFVYYNRQYYLAPDMPPSDGPKWYDAAHNPLWRMR